MATVPEAQEIKPEDFDKEDKELITKLAGPFNDFNTQIVQCLNRSLTFSENFRGEVKTLKYPSGTTSKSFKYNGTGSPSHVILSNISVKPTAAIFPYWTYDGKGTLTIEIIGTLPSQDVNITFIVIAG